MTYTFCKYNNNKWDKFQKATLYQTLQFIKVGITLQKLPRLSDISSSIAN